MGRLEATVTQWERGRQSRYPRADKARRDHTSRSGSWRCPSQESLRPSAGQTGRDVQSQKQPE